MSKYNIVDLKNEKIDCEITIDSYKERLDKLDLSVKEIDKIKKKITKQEKRLKELKSMIWTYDVGDIVLFKNDLREIKITKLVNIKVKGNRYIYYGDFINGSKNVAFSQDELMSKPVNHIEYIKLLQDKILELRR